MTIDQWAAQAPHAGPAEGETQEEYELRLARLRALSAENSAKHEWSRPRRRPDSPETGRKGCENCGGSRTYLFITPEGHKLCTECISEFASWILDGGITTDPDHWAAAMYDDRELAQQAMRKGGL